MLIRHWPLNGNTNDYSGFGYNLTNFGATSSTDGKIGSSYLFSSSYMRTPTIQRTTGQEITVAAWFKQTNRTGYQQLVANRDASGTYNWLLYFHTTDGSIQFHGSAQNKSNIIPTLNVWNHVVATVDSSQVCKVYLNGLLVHTVTGFTYGPAGSSYIHIGASFAGAEYFAGNINDVRIYDHALTDMEIQEIARAKILHYTFDDMQEPTTNLTPNYTISGWNNSGTAIMNSNETDVDRPFVQPEINIMSGETTATGSQMVGIYSTTVTPSTTYSVSIWYRQNRAGAGAPYVRTSVNNNSLGNFSYNGNPNSVNWPINQWIRITATVTVQENETGIYLSNYIGTQVGDKIWYYAYQAEQKDHITEYVYGSRTGRVNDYSGFFNHSDPLTETNTPRWTPEAKIGTGGYAFTPISNDSIFNENNAKMIDNNLVQLPYDQYTVSFWTYRTASGLQGGSYMRFGNYNAGLGFDTYDEVFNILAGQGAGISLASVSLSTTLNQWEHTTLVFNRFSPNILKKYTNGIFVANGTQNLAYINSDNTPTGYPFKIGISFAGGVARSYNGIIDDVRIYATALSDKDIKDLYEARAEIEQSGVLYARDFLSNAEETVNLHGDPNMTKQYTENAVVSKSNWGVDGTLFARKNTAPEAEFGSLMLEMNITSGSSGGLYTDLGRGSGREYTLVEGKTYTRSWWIKCSDTRTISGHVCSSNRGSDNLYILGPDIVVSPAWKKFSHTFTVASGEGGLYHTRHIIYNYIFSVWIANFQIEEKSYPTPFVSTYRPAIELPSTLDFAGNEVHETGTANFEDFSTVGITDGLVGYWPLDGDTRDLSGFNSTENTATAVTWTSGRVGGAANLNGSTSKIYINNNDAFNFSGNQQYTAMAMIYPRLGGTTWHGIFSKGEAQQWALTLNSPSGYLHYETNQGGVGALNTAVGTILANTWYHVAIRFNGTTKEIFINGSSAATQDASTLSSTSNTDVLRIGEGNGSELFNGIIDEVKIFNRALTAEEIAIEYNTMFNNEVQIHESGVLYAKDIIQY